MTEFKICAAEKLLLVQILFEEVSFKASFEGGEGKAVMERQQRDKYRFLQPRSKSMTTIVFSFEGGDVKSSIIQRRIQRLRRDKDLDKFGQVLRSSASDDLIAETSYFVFNSDLWGSSAVA